MKSLLAACAMLLATVAAADDYPIEWRLKPDPKSKSMQGSLTLGAGPVRRIDFNFAGAYREISADGKLERKGARATWTPPERGGTVGSSRVDLQACKLEYSIVSPK